MSGPVLLDTSGLYDAADRASQHHERCRSAFAQLLASGRSLLVPELVLAEVHALALRRVGPAPALALVERLVASPRVEVVSHDAARRDAAIAFLRARPGRSYTLADAASFQVMRDRGATVAFTLDADFRAEGFETIPDSG